MEPVRIYQLELTNRCNWACSFCPTRFAWTDRERGFASIELIDLIDWSQTKYVELQLSGEPCLHPQVADFVQRIKAKGVKVGVATNSSIPMDYSIFDHVTVTEAEGRKQVRAEPLSNTSLQRLGKDWPVEDYSHRIFPEEPARGCITPFRFVSVQWDGDVVPCCKCHGKQHVFGNLYDQPFAKILESHKRKSFLERMQAGSGNYICRYCTTPNPHSILERIEEKLR
jgi:radical SAM protein with 4Fe4S-binding SPASM domain